MLRPTIKLFPGSDSGGVVDFMDRREWLPRLKKGICSGWFPRKPQRHRFLATYYRRAARTQVARRRASNKDSVAEQVAETR